MSNQHPCPICDGKKETMTFVCGPNVGGLRALPCRTCGAKGWLSDEEVTALDVRETKHEERKARRIALNLSMREMAENLGVPFLTYNDYEHGRIDL